jgi:pimeloyl-ACP methyl ester carboxylesterase
LPQLALARDLTLVGIDRRGFGQSTAPADIAAEPDDVLRIADALGFARFHLLGMSQGGRVALALAARVPDRLLSLTLQGTALDGVAGEDENVPVAAMTAAARQGDLAVMRTLVRDHALMQPATSGGSALVAEMLADYDARDLLAPSRSLPAHADFIASTSCPVTAVVGAQDTAQRRSNSRALAGAGATAVELPGCGHLCNIDNPAGFNNALRAGLCR